MCGLAGWQRGTRLVGLVIYSDADSQFTSVRYGERLAEIGAVPLIGTIDGSFDKAVEDSRGRRTGHVVVGLLVRQRAPSWVPH